MNLLAGCLLFGVAVGGIAPETVDLVLPGHGPRLRLELTVLGQSPVAGWGAFLERWFDYFDRDGDGWLSRAEAARIFPLPVAGRPGAAFDFDKADANKDGKVSRAELKAFYRNAGFTPVQTVVQPPSLKDVQVAEALFRHLGPDGSGRLTRASLQRAAGLLRKLDENEDEVLTADEVLSLGADPKLKARKVSDCRWVSSEKQPAAALIRLVFAPGTRPSVRVAVVGKDLTLLPPGADPSGGRVRHPDGVVAFFPSQDDAGKAVSVSRQFMLAQFKSSAGNQKWLSKADVQDDANLQVLAELFAHADRDGDGKLTLAELDQFLALVEQGVRCPLVVDLTDGGRNLFGLLDANGDGRLDLKELNTAPGLLSENEKSKGWLRNEVPLQVRVSLQQGNVGNTFGPLPILVAAKPLQAPVAKKVFRGPAWFRAMDRNGDGFVSPGEFLGTLELFRRFDLNGDGLISPEEADLAEGKQRGNSPPDS